MKEGAFARTQDFCADFDFFAAEHADQAFKDEQEVVRTGKPVVGLEEKEVWQDGRVTWVSTTNMPLHYRRVLDGHSLSEHFQREPRIEPQHFGSLGPRLSGLA